MLLTDPNSLEKFSTPHRVWQGIPGIVQTKGGRLFVCFYSGSIKETYGNYAMIVKSEDGRAFGEPIAVATDTGASRCFDPVLWIDPLDRLWFIWNRTPGDLVFGSICENPDADELVWGKEFYIGHGVMMNKPTVLKDGRWLFPISIWPMTLHDYLRFPVLEEGEVSGAYAYETRDQGATFTRLGAVTYPEYGRTCDEHMFFECDDGSIRMLIRIRRGIAESFSYDGGRTWSEPTESSLKGPASRFFIRRLRSGRVLLINHYDFTDRNNLTALLSEDGGKTFPYRLLLDGRSNVSYPDAHEGEDGYIYLTYDRDRGGNCASLEQAYGHAREILVARITEKDILTGTLGEGSYLASVASKLGGLSPTDSDPYTVDGISSIPTP